MYDNLVVSTKIKYIQQIKELLLESGYRDCHPELNWIRFAEQEDHCIVFAFTDLKGNKVFNAWDDKDHRYQDRTTGLATLSNFAVCDWYPLNKVIVKRKDYVEDRRDSQVL